MSQAHGNPEELRIFAGALQKYLDVLNEETGQLDGAFNQLGDTWDDQKRREFEEVYMQLRNALDHFNEQAAEQVPYLQQLAVDLETYLSR